VLSVSLASAPVCTAYEIPILEAMTGLGFPLFVRNLRGAIQFSDSRTTSRRLANE
jgi:hypothetical protein